MIVSHRINARKVVLSYIYWVLYLEYYNNKGTKEQRSKGAKLISGKDVEEVHDEQSFVSMNEYGELRTENGSMDDELFLKEVGIKAEAQEEEAERAGPLENRGILEDDLAFIAKSEGIPADEIDWEYVLELAKQTSIYMPQMSQIINTYASEFSYEDMELLKKALFILGYTEHMVLGTDTKVIINEMIELAKRFGGVDTFKLINGVFHKILIGESQS